MSKTELLDFTKEELVDIIYKSIVDKDNLIKYLKNKINECNSKYDTLKSLKQIEMNTVVRLAYQDILESLKSGKYE